LVLHPQFDDFNEIIENDLEPNIYSFRILDAFLSKSQKHPFHIKFNTGLNRLGFSINDIDRLHNILGSTNNIKYIFSHLGASEDLEEKKFTFNQINLFEKIIEKIENKFCKKFNKHLLNSSGILNYPKYQYDMVRSGISLYGYGNSKIYKGELKPVLFLKSVISQIHEIKKGESVGYNRGFIANNDIKIAIIPIGHADGISRSLGNGKVGFIINNKVAKTVGNICMDMLMLDISQINCKEGDLVSIIDDQIQTAEDFGSSANTISYEILTALSSRIKRIVIS
jgi:alanine racemase